MKILLVAKPWKGGLPNYVLRALEQKFPGQVEYFPTYPETLIERLRYLQDKRAWRRALAQKINSGQYRASIFLHHLREFRELDHRENNLLWLIDGPMLERSDVHPYGKIFMSDMGYSESLRRCAPAGISVRELPFACDPAIHRPVKELQCPRGACFIGNKDPKRDTYLEWMYSHGCGPVVYGNYFFRHSLFWRHPFGFRSPVDIGRMGSIYEKYQVSINIHAQVVREGTNMRTFECAGYEIPQLVEYRPGLENFFEPEKEILMFHSVEECKEQMDRLLKDRGMASRIAGKARKRALAEHTYAHRLEELLNGIT